MRPLLIKDLSDAVQMMIRKRAWRDDVSYDTAAAEILHDAEIERLVERENTLMKRQADDGEPL
jgi:hypothetical protein